MLVVFLRRHKTDLQRIHCQGSASPVTTTTVNIASIAMETSLYLRRNISWHGRRRIGKQLLIRHFSQSICVLLSVGQGDYSYDIKRL